MSLNLLHPLPELARFDTGLRFTDILFGFVIKEIFVRLQYSENLPREVLLYLGVATALVLGSWIGYRRSLNRSAYEVKFFNLPFFRFVTDQAMLVLYFKVASATAVDLGKPIAGNQTAPVTPDPAVLGMSALTLLFYVFCLYLVWDFLGIWMARAKKGSSFRYPDPQGTINVDKETNTIKDWTKQQSRDWPALAITAIALLVVIILWLLSHGYGPGISAPNIFIAAIILLILYRFAKEVKTSWRQPQPKSA